MLKKTEGLVTLTVCNPNKAKDDGKTEGDGKNNSIISNKSDAKGKLFSTFLALIFSYTHLIYHFFFVF